MGKVQNFEMWEIKILNAIDPIIVEVESDELLAGLEVVDS